MSFAGAFLALAFAIGFMDSGGVVPPAWARIVFGLVTYGLLQPIAYWLLALGPAMSDWVDVARVALVCAFNSAVVTGIVLLAMRLYLAARAR